MALEPLTASTVLESCLSERDVEMVHTTQRHLTTGLDGYVHILVHDARSFVHGKDSTVDTFQIRLHHTLPVAEVRDLVEEKYEQISSYKSATDGPLQLFFNGRSVENGKLMAEYLSGAPVPQHRHKGQRARVEWPAPYAGILWIVPFKPHVNATKNLWLGLQSK